MRLLGSASSALVVIAAAGFFALGLEPTVSGLVNGKLPRWAAVSVVVVPVFGVLAAAVAAVVPPPMAEARQFIEAGPHYLQQAPDHSSAIGRFNEGFHVQQRITAMTYGPGAPTAAGGVKVGKTVFGALSHVGAVAVRTVYFFSTWLASG